MTETINTGLNGEEKKKQQEWNDAKEEANHFKIHPEQLIPPVTLREAEPEIAEFENMIASFESTHSLTELRAIIDLSPDLFTALDYADDLESPERIAKAIRVYEINNPGYVEVYKGKIVAAKAIVLTPEDAKKFEIRRNAKKDLAPIVKMLDTLKNKTNISLEKYNALKEKFSILQKAFGGIKRSEKNIEVDHS